MELGNEVLSGLQSAGNDTIIDDVCFSKVLKYAISIIQKTPDQDLGIIYEL